VDDWKDTRDTLHMWAQIIGKVRLAHAPLVNHWWQSTLYVSPRGLTTSTIPDGAGAFDMELDFLDHRLVVRSSTGEVRTVALEPKPVAEFHAETLDALAQLGHPTTIQATPNEVDPAIPFAEDHEHASYDAEAVQLFWRQLVQASRVLGEFRSRFVGKVSPVHLFWGSFDLAVTRFSGRSAPAHPGGVPNLPDDVAREAYSHEVTSLGFWPGNRQSPTPIFYGYAYPTPDGYRDVRVPPAAASWLADLGEFALPYEVVRAAADPDATLLAFAEATHAAAADLAGWDRAVLESSDRHPPTWWHRRHGG
jgi:hypothetical protein